MVGIAGDRPRRRAMLRALGWGLVLPVAALLLAAAGLAVGRPLLALVAVVLPLAGWGLLYLRVARGRTRGGEPASQAALYALFVVLAKLPEAIGVLRYALRSVRRAPKHLIEYKRPA